MNFEKKDKVNVLNPPLSKAQPRTVIVSLLSSEDERNKKMKKFGHEKFSSLKEKRRQSLPKYPAILMQLVAGNSPSRPFLPPMQGLSSIADE